MDFFIVEGRFLDYTYLHQLDLHFGINSISLAIILNSLCLYICFIFRIVKENKIKYNVGLHVDMETMVTYFNIISIL